MTRTLADMTPAERAACVGRWCEHKHPLYTSLEVVVEVHPASVTTLSPLHGKRTCAVGAMMNQVTPRFDLPRAWTPTGEPVEMEEEFGEVAFGRIWLDASWRTHLPEDTPVRRYVTDWEEA